MNGLWRLGVLCGALLAGCGDKGGGGETDPGNTTPQPPDTDEPRLSDTAPPLEPLVVAAIGFELWGGWNQETAELEPYLFPDLAATNGGAPFALVPIVQVRLAAIEYFEGTTDIPDEYCTFLALYTEFPSSASGLEFDWDAGAGGTGVELETWYMSDGFLTILEDTFESRCFELEEYVFPGGDPMELMDGMHFGMGYGPLSSYLASLFEDTTTTTTENPYDYTNAYLTQYIAINHPDGSGGYTFPAYDWNTALYVASDYTECVDYTYTSTAYTYSVCGLVQVDAALDVYVPGDVTVQPIHGYISGNAYWYEDTPNLDLSLLREGGL